MAIPESQWPAYVVASREKPHNNLWNIAEYYYGDGTKYTVLAAINNISNADYIVVGQKIYLKDHPDADKPPTTETEVPIITRLGFQASSDRTVLATWDWNRENTYSIYIYWWYGTDDGIAYKADSSHYGAATRERYSTFTPPENAKRVIFQVKAWSRYEVIDGELVYYWGDENGYSVSVQRRFELTDRQPDKPAVPTVRIEGNNLTATVNNLGGPDLPKVTEVEFQVVKNDSSLYKTGKSTVVTTTASWTTTVAAGHNYKVRCRARNEFGVSDWTEYTDSYGTVPAAPSTLRFCRAETSTSVYLEWTPVDTAETYEIQYAVAKEHLDSSNLASTASTTDDTNHYTLGNLTTGSIYYFRVRAKNSNGDSDWSEIKSTAIGTRATPPTTWSSTDVVIAGEEVILYWIHNSEDNSAQTKAIVNFNIHTVDETKGYSREIHSATSLLRLDTSEYPEGAEIQWVVCTAGVNGEYSKNSVSRTIKIVGEPYMGLSVTDKDDGALAGTLSSFPIRLHATAGPAAQHPIGYTVTITAETSYETVDQVGNPTTVHAGDKVYSKYIPCSGDLSIELSAGDLDLQYGQIYVIACVVAMDSGLTVEQQDSFFVMWSAIPNVPVPNAEIIIDDDVFAAHIRPYCNKTTYRIHKVTQQSGSYVTTTDLITSVYGEPVSGAKTTTGEQVYYGTTGTGEQVYYCTVRTSAVVDDVTFSVYRRGFDGSLVEIATDIENGNHTFVTDPHPPLDYARYRVVARHNATGEVNYYDVPARSVGGKAMIIQWDEAWTDFAIDNGNPSSERAWAGSMLKLMANVDISDQYNPDTSLVNYIGRKHPVGYYGTQIGETSSWSAVIPKDDKETLYAIRRLAKWMGNVYVREPSGSGYWANVKVSYSQKHRDVTIPISLDITRVEGGV